MEDKVIREFKVIEMEDGYRIEIRGDKEQLKKMFEHGPAGFMGFGGRFGRHGFGPFGHHRRGPWGNHGFGPWGWGDEAEGNQPGAPNTADRA